MADARFWFLNPIDAIDAEAYAGPLLGSVVKDYKDPQWKRFPEPGKMFPCDRNERLPVELSDVQLHRAYGHDRSSGGSLTSLMDVQHSKTGAQTITLKTAKKMTYRRLLDAQQVFKDLRQEGRGNQKNTEEDSLNLRKTLLGRVFDEDNPPSKILFNMVPRVQWLNWLKSVDTWLRIASYPPLEEGRHYILKTLVDVMAYCANLACMAVPPHRALPSYERLLAKQEIENQRLEIYHSLHPSIIGPTDFILARTGKITATILLSLSNEAIEAGNIDIRVLAETKAEALLLAKEQENNGRWREQHHFYALAVQACFQMFTLFPNPGLDNDIFEIFEKMEECRHVVRRREMLAEASKFLQEQGFCVIQPMATALVSLLADFAPVLSACTAEVKLCSDKLSDDPQTLRAYPLSPSCSDEEQRAFTAVSRLTKWIQRSNGQAILDLTQGTASAIPPAILKSVYASKNAQRLLDREAQLTKQAEQNMLSDQVNALRELDVCLVAQSQEPALTEFVQWCQSLAASFEEIQAILQGCERDVVLVDWYSCHWPKDDTIYIQVHRRGQWLLPCKINGLNALSLQNWLQTHVDTEQPFFMNKESQAVALNNLISLVEPLTRFAQAGETLVLCPFGKLHRIPLHAIPIENNLALIERNPIVYCQSFAQLKRALGLPRPESNRNVKALLICSLGNEGFAPSIAPSATIASLGQQIPNLKVTNRTEVDKTEALERLRASDLLVLLGHVDFQPATPMLSAFHLTATKKVNLDAPNTRLSAADIFNTVMRRRAVVLQLGCGSGAAQVSSSGDHLGLNTAFFAAGASTVVSTLWDVDIADALPFLRTFVACWIKESQSVAAHGRRQVNLARVFQHSVLRFKVMPRDEKRVTDWTAFTLHGLFLVDPLDVADNGRKAADK